MVKFKWKGPENYFVGDAGGEGRRMNTAADSYDSDDFSDYAIKAWKKKNWYKEI
jgi:hypothetical protein